jgi:hypothetical protein
VDGKKAVGGRNKRLELHKSFIDTETADVKQIQPAMQRR